MAMKKGGDLDRHSIIIDIDSLAPIFRNEELLETVCDTSKILDLLTNGRGIRSNRKDIFKGMKV